MCVSLPSQKTHFPVDWRLLVEERFANIGLPPDVIGFLLFLWLIALGSTVRLRFQKSIFGHHSQTIGKSASIDFNYHTEVVDSI